MAPTNEPSPNDEDTRRRSFVVADLALWAGDLPTAKRLLTEVIGTRRTRRSELYPEDLLRESAAHRLRQLKRRESEYRSLGLAAGLSGDQLLPQVPITTTRKLLGGIVHHIEDLEFEFRVYLMDLTQEKQFYQKLRVLGDNPNPIVRIIRGIPNDSLCYGDIDSSVAEDIQDENSAPTALDIVFGWRFDNEYFAQVVVSDFCTLQARFVCLSGFIEPDDIRPVCEKLLTQIEETRI